VYGFSSSVCDKKTFRRREAFMRLGNELYNKNREEIKEK
jgi:hypothetical protein